MSEALVKEWIEKAEQDYESAVSLARKRKRPVPDSVCFHCQQACEKLFKAFMTHLNLNPPKSHDLILLVETIATIDTEFGAVAKYANILNPYAVEFRYPGESATSEDSLEAIRAMKIIRVFVRRKL
jgi:HEPN domain-containing protein